MNVILKAFEKPVESVRPTKEADFSLFVWLSVVYSQRMFARAEKVNACERKVAG